MDGWIGVEDVDYDVDFDVDFDVDVDDVDDDVHSANPIQEMIIKKGTGN